MLKRILALVMLFTTLKVVAKVEEVSGVIITDTETREVVFKIPIANKKVNFEKIQYFAKYIDSKGKTQKLWPETVKEIQFNYKNFKYRLYTKYNDFGFNTKGNYIFLKILVEGKYNLYEYYSADYDQGMYGGVHATGHSITYVIEDESDKLTLLKSGKYKKNLIEYFKNYPDLIKVIDRKTFRYEHIKQLVIDCNSTE